MPMIIKRINIDLTIIPAIPYPGNVIAARKSANSDSIGYNLQPDSEQASVVTDFLTPFFSV